MNGLARILSYANVAAITLFQGAVSFAGPISSGGGNSLVCYAENGEIANARLLDTYEGSQAFGDKHVAENDPIESYISLAKSRLATTGYNTFLPGNIGYEEAIDHVKAKMRILSDNVELERINDSFEFAIPSGCEVLQTAIFLDENNIVVRGKIWNALSNRDKAGLILHESIYWLDRQARLEQDSRRSRRTVSKLLGENWDFVDVQKSLPTAYTLCQSVNTSHSEVHKQTLFASYPLNSDFAVVSFFMINGDYVLSEALVYVPSEFPFLKTTNHSSFSAEGSVQSSFENGHPVKLEASYDAKGTKSLSVVVEKPSYPSWESVKQTLTCRSINE